MYVTVSYGDVGGEGTENGGSACTCVKLWRCERREAMELWEERELWRKCMCMCKAKEM